MAYVKRDPFAREELHRESVRAHDTTCAWCGQQRLSRNSTSLYRYRVETDGGSVYEDARLFCSVSCREAYQ